MPEALQKGEKVYRGIAVSAGISRGRIIVLGKTTRSIAQHSLTDSEAAEEVTRMEKAFLQTREQIIDVQQKVTEAMGAKEGSIFDAHLLVLEDRVLIDEIIRLISEQKVNAEHAFHTVAEKYISSLAAIDDEYLRERAADLRDVTERVLNNLQGLSQDKDLRRLKEPALIIAHDLTPSDTAQLDRLRVLGFATDVGSRTSHTAIMARSMRIPAVVGLKNATSELETGQYALVDGFNGVVIVNPTDQTLFEYGQLIRKQVTLEEKLRDTISKPSVTLDGQKILLSANIEQADDAEAVQASGAEGVGLYRTEYLFINRESLPSEEEQYREYRRAAVALKPNHIVIRTLDLGGDKFLSHLATAREMNPFLGWRAIRFCLAQPELFCAQLRAILRASAEGNVKMMYPMISGLDELNQANALVEKCKIELREQGIAFDENLPIGAMIEIPSAAMIADVLATRVKFFSIGTNDLIQYALAVDRMNERIAHLYEPTHPAILRLIKMTVDAAQKHGISVSVCGEMGGEVTFTALLIGLGVDELSAAPPLIPQIKFLLRRLKMTEAKELADFALGCESTTEILARAQELARNIAPSLFENKL
ncbi:MAG TPA: phosphoenolpyruvate--protein phosphotransferase [Verrucomicrobiae bacterium]|nr:phosphoenolpyruvate--protein phosphotransferase [Verrucomicrobiae bacterium]